MLPHDDVGAGPAVVLLHAGIADRTMWAEHLEPLAAVGFRVIAVDLPGFGEAPEGVGEHAPWNDVALTLNELGIERAALVGNSFGGAVALRFGVLAPKRAWALALISAPPPGREPSPVLAAAWEAEEQALERGDVEGAVAAVVDAWTQPGAAPALRERVAAMQRRAFDLQLGKPEPPAAPDPVTAPRDLAAIEAPTLVVAGARDMPDFVEGAAAITAAIPGARQELVADAGHLAPLETPDEFQQLVGGFLRAVAPRA